MESAYFKMANATFIFLHLYKQNYWSYEMFDHLQEKYNYISNTVFQDIVSKGQWFALKWVDKSVLVL